MQHPDKRHDGNIPQNDNKVEDWQKLCEEAAEERDPARLMELVEQIDKILAAKERPRPQSA